ncbi:hypothetical protein R1sor_018987 [Riccia sorocarpa]|uniref:RING-type domain-containing protein n=1 Tax=Riccia sorocarpa TaxID=122646 RepID=A0ABD3IB94_9MARC
MADQWGGKCKREKSHVIETSEALAFQNISTLVQAMESEAWGQTIKSQKTEDTLESLDLIASSSAIEVYQTPSLAIVHDVNFKFTFEELGVLTRDEVLPYVDTSRMTDDGIVKVNSAMFSRGAMEGAKEYNIDISVEGLKRLVDFLAVGDCAKVVPPSVIEKVFFDHCGQKHKKDAWKVIAPWFRFNLNNAQPRNEGWVIDDFRKFTLENHPHGSVLDMRVRLVIRQVLRTLGKLSQQYCSTTLVLLAVAHVDPTSAHLRPDWHMFVSSEIRKSMNHEKTDKKSVVKFLRRLGGYHRANTKAEWDNEKCELFRQREELKEELAKAQELAALAAKREQTIRLEKDALQKEYSKEKPKSKVMELLKSGKKWQLSCYPKVFDAKDLTEWKGSVVLVLCTFCKGLLALGTDLRIPTCGHSYHISYVCSSFGLNHLACWAESCSQTLPTP